MNLPAIILVHLLWIEATYTKRTSSPLSLQMAFVHDTEASHISGNEQAFVPEMNLNHGTYHSNAYLMDSVSLSLHGSDTTICHTSSLAKAETANDLNRDGQPNRDENTTAFIFVFSNSTMSMSHISLDCGWRGTSVGRISSSRLTIDNCPIISNPESSPFVIHNGWDDIGSSIFFVDCSHCSIDKSSLLTLVSLTPSHFTSARHTHTEQEVSSTLVSCSGLSLCNTDLVSGSGPLVGLSSWTEQDTGLWKNLETVLIGSRLVNMTSGELRGNEKMKGALEGCSGCQKILDSCVTLSTNHLYGTACIDMNLGGSLLCSNTSFSHCHSSLEPEFTENKTYTLQHRTEAQRLEFTRAHTEDITFRRCTFLSMTTTDGGAAIRHTYSPTKLTVSQCSFSKCSAAFSGGAIFFSHDPCLQCHIDISSSLFVGCSALSDGGATSIGHATTSIIKDIVCHGNRAAGCGGSLLTEFSGSLSFSNCVFEKCIADYSVPRYPGGGGGGLCIYTCPPLTMDSVLFRKCSSPTGNDLYYEGGWIPTLSQTIAHCDSTSEMPNVFVFGPDISDDTLITAVPDTSTATLVGIESTPSVDQTSSTIQMKVSESVDGKMLVLVDNTNNHEPPNVDSPPTIGRLLTFDFSTSTESATQEVSFGEWEELQYQSEYCVIGSSIAKTRLSFSSSIGLTTPNPARIVQIICSLGSGTDHCWLELKGRTLEAGTYTVKLVGIDDFSFSVEFDGTTGSNTLNMFSSRHSERLFGTGSKLSFSTTYEVESVTLEVNNELVILDPPRLFFTTPAEQPRLTSVGTVRFKDESTADVVLIPLAGVNLLNGEYELKLRSSLLEAVSITLTLSASNSATIEVVVSSKETNQIKLEYGEVYTVKELITGTTKCLFETAFSIQVPAEPKRIEEGKVTLNGAKDEATLRLKGRALTGGSYSLKLNSVSTELSSEESLSDDGELLFKVPISHSPSSILGFGVTYTISLLKFGEENVFVNSNVKLAVPAFSLVKTAHIHPNTINTSVTLGLTGVDLKLDGFYIVTLSPPFSLDMLFNSSTTASSAELLLGRAGCLQHNTKYTIVSISRVEDASNVIQTEGTVSFTTPKLPVPLILHVNEKEGKDNDFCGESDDPCSTIDFAWSIVSALKGKSAILAIVNSSRQTQPIVVSSGMSILLSNGGTLEPTLTIPSSASMRNKAGMVVVDSAGFEVDDVKIKIESTDPSFVFLSASESTIILKEGSFVGEPLPTLSLISESEGVCSWESGIIRLNNCVTTLNRMTFSSISQGAMKMESGTLSLRESSFDGNSPNIPSFPSARRNIRCVENGNVTIGSLNGGDGSKDHPSAWISGTDCTVSGDDARPNSALFVPTLSSESNSTWMKKEKRFSVLIVGTTLIPCELCLEVFEMKKDKSEGESERVELSFDTTNSFNETHITISIPLTSLSSLKDALEWRGRLVFGLNETTSDSFLIQKNSSDRMSQSALENLKWWLPLVIVLLCCALVVIIVVVLVLRRRQKRKTQKQPNDTEEMHDEEKTEVQDNLLSQNSIQTSAGILKGKSLTQNCGESSNQSTKLNDIQGMPMSSQQFVEVMDVESGKTKEVVKLETLFDRLHKHRNQIVGKRQRQIEITRGLQKIGKTNGNAWILQKLTSHWILIGADGHFNLQLKEDGTAATEHRSQSQAAASSVAEGTGSVNVRNENMNEMDRAAKVVREKEDQEGQRWQAPEQGENDVMPSCDVEKVTVFRLGLVLWEMESGQIPFRETDGVNAGRQLKAGVKPQMSLVGNKEMEELILKCLELKSTDRIGLDDLISSLESIPDDPVPAQP